MSFLKTIGTGALFLSLFLAVVGGLIFGLASAVSAGYGEITLGSVLFVLFGVVAYGLGREFEDI